LCRGELWVDAVCLDEEACADLQWYITAVNH